VATPERRGAQTKITMIPSTISSCARDGVCFFIGRTMLAAQEARRRELARAFASLVSDLSAPSRNTLEREQRGGTSQRSSVDSLRGILSRRRARSRSLRRRARTHFLRRTAA